MWTRRTILAVLMGGLWLHLASPASAQAPGGGSSAFYSPYAALGYTQQPTVSPYLNLGVTTDGLSNYQTLVRPMLENQEAVQSQATSLQQLQRQMQRSSRGAGQRNLNTAGPGPRSASGSYMNYSHFYSGIR